MSRYATHPRGDRQRARLIESLEKPQTAAQLAKAINLSVSGVLIYVKELSSEPRQVRICGYVPSPNGRPAPVYALGSEDDAIYQSTRKPKLEDRATKQMRKVVEALKDPRTAEAVGIAVCLSTARARFYISALRAEGKAHIKGWEHPNGRGDHAPIYALGNRQDKPKPRQTRAERYRQEKADPEKYELNLSRRRAHHRVAKAIKTPQNPFSALFTGGAHA